MTEWKQVTKAEFESFLSEYPNKLVRDVISICEPPMISYNDFSQGKVWPDSMVAKINLNTEMAGYKSYKGNPDDYWIKRND